MWAFVLTGSTPWATSSATVLGVGLIVVAGVGIVGMIGGAARWAHRLAVGLGIAEVALAVPHEISPMTSAGLFFGGAALAGLGGTAMRGMVRQRPPADGPPPKSVALAITLLVSPPIWALASLDGLGTYGTIASIVTWAAMAHYVKAWPFALPFVRLVLPTTLIVCAVASDVITGSAIATSAIVAGYLAWTVAVRVAINPLATPGKAVPIPAELAPVEILDAAGIDDHGQPRRGDR